MELRYRAPARPDQIDPRHGARCGPRASRGSSSTTRSGASRASSSPRRETEQVVVNAEGELLLTLPSGLRALCTSILEFQEAADARAVNDRRRARLRPAPLAGFLARFAALLVAFYFLVAWHPVNDARRRAVHGRQSPASPAAVLNVLGENVTVAGTEIRSARLRGPDRERLQRRRDGSPLRRGRPGVSRALAAPARSASPRDSPRSRLINLVRVVSLFWIGAHRPALFSSSHTVLWQSVVVLVRRAPLPRSGPRASRGARRAPAGAGRREPARRKAATRRPPERRRPAASARPRAAVRLARGIRGRPRRSGSRSPRPTSAPSPRRRRPSLRVFESPPSTTLAGRRTARSAWTARTSLRPRRARACRRRTCTSTSSCSRRSSRSARDPSSRRAFGAVLARGGGSSSSIHVAALVFQVEALYATRLGALERGALRSRRPQPLGGRVPLLPGRRPVRGAVRLLVVDWADSRSARSEETASGATAGSAPGADTGSPGSRTP